ncbi:DUF3025 domain-containing protein [Noviherbaspirillum sp.]|uniref:DUF3025 domain-containing protein n=1 Tax=Noviherbaspirillum sp. TaxID=1926288 RepID=UPI002FDF33E3
MPEKQFPGKWLDCQSLKYSALIAPVVSTAHLTMSTRFTDLIDWQQPWLTPLLPLADIATKATDWMRTFNEAAALLNVRNHQGLPIKLVPQANLPPECAYETFISDTGSVPTRQNLHDFLNALVWLSYPRVKARLNELQAAEILKASVGMPNERQGVNHARGKVRDAATIFDENAAIVIVTDASQMEALHEHRWHQVFIQNRLTFGRTWDVNLFGHALMEKLVMPYKAITAHAFIVQVEEHFFSLSQKQRMHLLDQQIAQNLSENLSTADFTPLPVLGLPEWWPDQSEEFYNDAAVFRPKRKLHRPN